MTTMEQTIIDDEAFSHLLAAGANSLAVRKANPRRYWAHRPERETFYYWEEVPVSRPEYVAAIGEDLAE
jgi:hypothetical protein